MRQYWRYVASTHMRFRVCQRVPVRAPYRLDLTVQALRRLARNAVDVLDEDGVYRRALRDERGVNVVAVRQSCARELEVRVAGLEGARWLATVERMLGTQVELEPWYRTARTPAWLGALARDFRGLKPPRYPNLWEALAHAVVFAQISMHAAAAIMRRMVEACGEPVFCEGLRLYAFPSPQALAAASDERLRACGLSRNKIVYLRAAARAVLEETLVQSALEERASGQAIDLLCGLRGIGPWSAAVVLLRGFGRLDVFPRGDSGVARAIARLGGDPGISLERLLERLGPVRGMLYFHLLLAGARNRARAPGSLRGV